MKKKNNLVSRIRELRKKIRERVKEKVLSEYEEKKKSGKYPWEGMWLTPQEISKVQARMKKRDRVAFAELLVLFLVLAVSLITLLRLVLVMMPQ